MNLVGWLGALLLFLAFAPAVLSHLRSPERIETAVRSIGLVKGFAWLASGVEAAVCVSLLANPRVGSALAGAYLAVLIAVFGIVRVSGRTLTDCGCTAKPHSLSAGWFLRNGLLFAVAVLTMGNAPPGLSVPWALSAAIIACVVVAALVAHRSTARLRGDLGTVVTDDGHAS